MEERIMEKVYEGWQLRVMEEQEELVDKIIKLGKYLDDNYDDLLCIQLSVMKLYSNVLKSRIDKF
jgi:hypothetical protein